MRLVRSPCHVGLVANKISRITAIRADHEKRVGIYTSPYPPYTYFESIMSPSIKSCQSLRGVVSNRSPYSGKLHPNGEVCIGINTHKSQDLPNESQMRHRYKGFNPRANGYATDRKYWEIRRAVERCISREMDSSLGLSPPTNSHTHTKPRSRRGLKGITAKQKRRIRNCAYLLSESSYRRTLALLTLTVPSLSDAAIAAINQNWAAILRVFLQWLQRRLMRAGLPGEYVSVTEIQEKRFQGTGQVPLHLHVLFQGRATPFCQWVLNPIEVREAWLRSLSKFAGEKLESKSCERIEMVRGNAGAYLAKYMSKGSEVISAVKDAGLSEQLPKTWVNISASLKSRYASAIKVIDGKAFLILKHLPLFQRMGMVTYVHEFWLPPSQEGLPQTLIGVAMRFQNIATYELACSYMEACESSLYADTEESATAA